MNDYKDSATSIPTGFGVASGIPPIAAPAPGGVLRNAEPEGPLRSPEIILKPPDRCDVIRARANTHASDLQNRMLRLDAVESQDLGARVAIKYGDADLDFPRLINEAGDYIADHHRDRIADKIHNARQGADIAGLRTNQRIRMMFINLTCTHIRHRTSTHQWLNDEQHTGPQLHQ